MLMWMLRQTIQRILSLLLLAVPLHATSASFDFGPVVLDFPGEWELVDLKDLRGYIAVSERDGTQFFLAASEWPLGIESEDEVKERWDQMEKQFDRLFFTTSFSSNTVLIVPDTTTNLGEGVALREIVFDFRSAEKGNPLAFFVLKRFPFAMYVSPSPEHATPETLPLIRDVLRRARWR